MLLLVFRNPLSHAPRLKAGVGGVWSLGVSFYCFFFNNSYSYSYFWCGVLGFRVLGFGYFGIWVVGVQGLWGFSGSGLGTFGGCRRFRVSKP